jgi:predicted nucleic acid-binding protein
MAAVRAFHEDVYPLLQVVWTAESEHIAAMDSMLTFSRRKLSLVDCASFHVMRAHGVRTAFCFDAHFREQGFTVKP